MPFPCPERPWRFLRGEEHPGSQPTARPTSSANSFITPVTVILMNVYLIFLV